MCMLPPATPQARRGDRRPEARIRETSWLRSHETCVGPFSYEGAFKGHLGEIKWQAASLKSLNLAKPDSPPIIGEWPKEGQTCRKNEQNN